MEIVDIASSKLTFSYLENNNVSFSRHPPLPFLFQQAALEFFVCSRNGEPARLVLTVNVIDFIKVCDFDTFPPVVVTGCGSQSRNELHGCSLGETVTEVFV